MSPPQKPRTTSLDRHRIRRAVDRWHAGDDRDGSFRELADLFYRPLHRFFEKRGLAPEDAHDLTQETFVRIYRGMDDFRRESGFETWIFAIAANVFLRAERDRRAQKRGAGVRPLSLDQDPVGNSPAGVGEMPAPDATSGPWATRRPDPLEGLIQDQRLERLRAAMAELPPRMRTVLGLSIYQERTRQEIAEALGLSQETVKAHLHQARRRLARALRCADDPNAPDSDSQEVP